MKSARKWMFPVATMSLAGMLVAGCGSSTPSSNNNTTNNTTTNAEQPKDGGTLTMANFSDIVTLNPIYIDDVPSQDAASFIFAPLCEYDQHANLVADDWSLAAEVPQVSADGKTYTVKLKDGLKWSDGQPVTADDVVFTINAIRNKAYNSPGISNFDKVKEVKKLDDHTVQVTLKQVYAPFIYYLGLLQPVPAHILKDVKPADLQKNPFGTDPTKTVSDGPWKWTEWKQKDHLTFDINPDYWGPKPHIQQIVYKIYADQNTEVQALLKGDVDFLSGVPVTQLSLVQSKSNLTTIAEPGPYYEYLAFNFKDSNFPDNWSPFHGEKTRQAIAYAINRDGILQNVLKGTGKPLSTPFLPGSWADPGDAATTYNYDPEKAKQLLAEDGWKPGPDGILVKDGHRFSFELQYNAGNSRREQVAAIIQQNLKAVGIEVKPRALDFSSWIAQNINPGKFQAVLLGWQFTTPDPDNESVFSSKYFPPNGQNMGWYKNTELDKLWVEGYSTTDQAKRKEIYNKIAQIISTDLPYVFLYQYGSPLAASKKVHWAPEDAPQISLPGTGYFYHIEKWWIDNSQ